MYLTELINRHKVDLEKMNNEPLCFRIITTTTKRYIYIKDHCLIVKLSSPEGILDVPFNVEDMTSQEWHFEYKEAMCLRNLRPVNLVGV